jgi:hypothetical protein
VTDKKPVSFNLESSGACAQLAETAQMPAAASASVCSGVFKSLELNFIDAAFQILRDWIRLT